MSCKEANRKLGPAAEERLRTEWDIHHNLQIYEIHADITDFQKLKNTCHIAIHSNRTTHGCSGTEGNRISAQAEVTVYKWNRPSYVKICRELQNF